MLFLQASCLSEELDPWNKLLRELGDFFLCFVVQGVLWCGIFCLFLKSQVKHLIQYEVN